MEDGGPSKEENPRHLESGDWRHFWKVEKGGTVKVENGGTLDEVEIGGSGPCKWRMAGPWIKWNRAAPWRDG
jgi:hypothetical protein